MNKAETVPLKVKFGYGSGEFASSILWITIAFWLMNFMTDEVGLSAGLAGLALMVGKIWDAVTDPVVGFLSDRTKSRWGRRRPWFLFGAVPFGLTFLLMFTNFGFESQTSMFIWITLTFILLCTAYTCCTVPYNALLPELSKDFNERSSISGVKSIFAISATIFGAGLAMPIISSFASRTSGFIAMGAIFGVLIIITTLIPFFTVKESPAPEKKHDKNILKSNAEAFKNKPFVLLLTTWFFNTCGFTMLSAILVYYFKYIYQDETLITLASVIMLGTSMLFIPVAVKVASKIGKRNTYILGMSFLTVTIIVLSLVGHLFGVTIVYIIIFFSGMGLSTHYVMPWSLIPDTVEYDYSVTGVRKEGVYYGLWTFSIKIGQAFAGLLLGLILSFHGYIPDVLQSSFSLLGIRMLIGPYPAVFFIIGTIILSLYPINEKKYTEIQQTIKEMEKEQLKP